MGLITLKDGSVHEASELWITCPAWMADKYSEVATLKAQKPKPKPPAVCIHDVALTEECWTCAEDYGGLTRATYVIPVRSGP